MGDDTIHTVPLNDLIEHDTTVDSDCICGPETIAVFRDDGSVGWLVIHHSLDGRELYEHDEVKTKSDEALIWIILLVVLCAFWGIVFGVTVVK